MRRSAVHRVLLTLTIAVGCTSADPTPDDHRGSASEGAGAVTDASPSARAADTADTADAHDAHASTAGAGELLLPIMQRLGTSMVALTHGLMTDDHAAVQRSAAAIADHVPIAAADLARIRRVLGAEMGEFERLDAAVHDAAVRLHQAAEGGDPARVVTVLAEVQRGCVGCHARFRERLRTNP